MCMLTIGVKQMVQQACADAISAGWVYPLAALKKQLHFIRLIIPPKNKKRGADLSAAPRC